MQRIQGFAEQGNTYVLTAGQRSVNVVQGSYPFATVTVFLTGTTALATIFADNQQLPTPLPNPFLADANGHWFFYVANGRYDIQLSGGGLPCPWTIGDVQAADPFSGAGGVSSFNGRTGAVMPVAGDYDTSQIKCYPQVSASLYDFPPQTPGIALTAGVANTVTLTPVPRGVNGSDSFHYLYISGGTGAGPEAVLITGGTAVSGAASGTIIFTPAGGHSGAWTISSVMGGIPEACSLIAATGGTVTIKAQTVLARGPLVISAPNTTLEGQGFASVIQAAPGAGLGTFINVTNTANGFNMRNLTVDGNRSNGGMNPGTGAAMFDVWAVQIASSDTTIQNCEIRFSVATGLFVGDNTVTPIHVVIDNCYIHDNGGVTQQGSDFPTPGGIGIGIFTGGARAPLGMTITNCLIANNYNTVLTPGDSTGLNLYSTHNLIANNVIINNFNRGGGQVAIEDPTGTGGGPTDTTITGNIILCTTRFGGDITVGVELTGSYVTITGNSFANLWLAVDIELTSSHVTVANNVARNMTQSGLQIFIESGQAPSFITVTGNDFTSGNIGIDLNSSAGDLSARLTSSSIVGNNLFGNTTPINGVANYTNPALNVEVRNNPGYNGAATGALIGPITVGPSPFTYNAGISPEVIYLEGGTVSTVQKLGGATGAIVARQTNCTVALAPNQGMTVTYTALPVMIRDIQ